MLAPLAFVLFFSFKIQTMSASAAQMTFWAFCAVMGLVARLGIPSSSPA